MGTSLDKGGMHALNYGISIIAHAVGDFVMFGHLQHMSIRGCNVYSVVYVCFYHILHPLMFRLAYMLPQ